MVLFSALPTNLGNRSSRFPHSHRHDYDGIIPKTSRLRDTHSEGKVTLPFRVQGETRGSRRVLPCSAAIGMLSKAALYLPSGTDGTISLLDLTDWGEHPGYPSPGYPARSSSR